MGILLASVLKAGAMLGGLAGYGGGVLIVATLAVCAVVSLLPLLFMTVNEPSGEPVDVDARQMLSSL